MRVLGIMSGTSVDGVDYALCDVAPERVRLLRLHHAPFPATLRRRIHAAAAGSSTSHETGQLHHDLGRFYATHTPATVDRLELVGLHGQTVFHRPHRRCPATFQIGEPAYLAESLRVPVVSNFRAGDIAAGGQGAPLATRFHQVAFGRPGHHVCVNNLGGISNVTSLDFRTQNRERVLAFDTGPANVLADLAFRRLTRGRQHYDRNGAIAARGMPVASLLKQWLRHPYFRLPPPKSTGRETFGEPFLDQAWPALKRFPPEVILATLTEFTAQSLALSYQRHLTSPPDQVILTGGGAANPFMVARIREALRSLHSDVQVQTSEQLGWPCQAIEPAAFALLAYYRWHHLPGNLPETTGAGHPARLGQVTVP